MRWSCSMQAAEKLADRDPPPEIATPMKYPERLAGAAGGRVVVASVWLRLRRSSGTRTEFSATFLFVQAGRRMQNAKCRMQNGTRGAGDFILHFAFCILHSSIPALSWRRERDARHDGRDRDRGGANRVGAGGWGQMGGGGLPAIRQQACGA